MARRIQQASLPREVPELEGWQISPHYRLAREVGGDFYDFHFLSNGRLGSSWGTQQARACSASYVSHLRHASGSLTSLRLLYSPGEELARVNETLLVRLPANMFVTCFYAILDPKCGTLSFANAGHDLP